MSKSDRPGQDAHATRWEYPDITSEDHFTSLRRNAVNKPMRWRYEPPETEPAQDTAEDSPPQLTAEELETIRAEAQQEGHAEGHQEGLKSGYDEGFQSGYDEGLLKGREAGESEAKVSAEQINQELGLRWQQLFDHMRHPALQINEGVERQLVLMTTALAKAICLHEIQTNPTIIQQVVHQAVSELDEQAKELTLSLHPQDLALIEQRWSEQERAEMGWRLRGDETLTRGGCVVETAVTRVDASLESRINDVFRRYVQGITPSRGESLRTEPEVDAVEQLKASRASVADNDIAESAGDMPEESTSGDSTSGSTAPQDTRAEDNHE